MAANPYTMLKSMADMLNADLTGENCKQIAHAMLYTETADYIYESLDIYDLASNGIEKEDFRYTLQKFINALLPKYAKIYDYLNQPETITEWHHVVSSLKTSAKGKYNAMYHDRFSMWDFMGENEKLTFRMVESDKIL